MQNPRDMKLHCHWTPPWFFRLYAERAAHDRAGRPRAVVTGADIEAELVEVARRRRMTEAAADAADTGE